MPEDTERASAEWAPDPSENAIQTESSTTSGGRRGRNGEINPLLSKLTPAQFDATVRFYEADRHLTTEDRAVVAKDLQRIVFNLSVAGYTASMLAFFGPTLLRRYRMPVKVALGAGLNWRIHRPLFSLFLGWATMMAVKSQVMTSMFRSRAGTVNEDNSNERVANVWQAMDPHFAGMFYYYFRKTAQFPELVFPDPRTVTEQSLRNMFFQPGPGQSRDGHFSERLGFDRNDDDDHVLSHWDKIRIANGFGAEREKQAEAEDTLFSPLSDKDAPNDNRKRSAWDSVREGSK